MNIEMTPKEQEQMERVREKIFDLITDPPCRNCDWWVVQERYCWLKDQHLDSSKCELINQILSISELAVLHPDQEMPEIDAIEWHGDVGFGTRLYTAEHQEGYGWALKDMLSQGWRRMIER